MNLNGQLGDGTGVDRWVPGPVQGLTSGVQAVSTATRIRARWSTAPPSAGVGTPSGKSATTRPGPTACLRFPSRDCSGVQAITAGDEHTCAVTSAGAKCWGRTAPESSATTRWSTARSRCRYKVVAGGSKAGNRPGSPGVITYGHAESAGLTGPRTLGWPRYLRRSGPRRRGVQRQRRLFTTTNPRDRTQPLTASAAVTVAKGSPG